MIVRFFLFFLTLCLPYVNFALEPQTPSPVQFEIIAEEKTVQPGRPFWIALRFNIEKDWHVYWKNPGDAGMPLKIDWHIANQEATISPLQWPFPEKFNLEDLVGFGYHDQVLLLAQVTPSSHLDTGKSLTLSAEAQWLVCSDMHCQPGSAKTSLDLKVVTDKPQIDEALSAAFKEARAKLPSSHVSIKTVHKEGVVQLQVPEALPEHDKVVGVYFFPEEKDLIDHSIDPMLAMNPQTDNKYFVNLKGSEEIGAPKNNHLKGVLVVHTQKDTQQKVQAFDVNTPIQKETDQGLVSFIDIPTTLSTTRSSSANFEGGLGLALIFAFIGGMILNLMPCVLPVMSFKVMSFVKMAGESRSLTLKHGCMFSVGVIVSFWALAGSMLLLRAYGQAVGWGFQLQEPIFVVILASLLFIFALSLFGLFEWGLFFASWAGQAQVETARASSSGYTGSFFSGVLATAVATPCTGPFLGSAVGFAVTLPAFQALIIFTSLALGMSFPYLLLAAFPSFLRFLPKPGMWMETFKQVMGFVLLATVLWLVWVFSAQTNSFALVCLLAGFLCFAIAAWIYGKWSSPLMSRSRRLFVYTCVLLIGFMGVQTILYPKQQWDEVQERATMDDWETFSPERVAELRAKGVPVLIDFTAKWCLICQANHLVLSSEDLSSEIADAGIVKMKADWTKNDPIITQELSKFGRTSVPLYVLYGNDPQKDAIILPQVLTPDVVKDHIKTAIVNEQIAIH